MHWYFDVLGKYAEFSGRARRQEYWMFFLFNFIFAFVLGFIGGILGAVTGTRSIGNGISGLYTLALLLPGLAVAVRRIHDSGHSGWWILLPIVNLVFLCLDSEPGQNEYGPNPKMA